MEEKLKQAFVGKKYEIFEKKVFSLPTFFFGAIYFAYRKMFGKALILTILLNIMYSMMFKYLEGGMLFLAMFCLNTAIALFFPLWYKTFYNKTVEKIIKNNPGKSEEELIKIATSKGGTSVIFVILYTIVNSVLIGMIIMGSLVGLLFKGGSQLLDNVTIETNFNNSVITNTNEKNDNVENIDLSNAKLIERVKVTGYMSAMGHCELYFKSLDDENYDGTYTCNKDLFNLIYFTEDYEVYADIYVTEGENPVLLDVKLYNEKTGEEINGITNEEELRDNLGLYITGEYEEELTFLEIGRYGGGTTEKDDKQVKFSICNLLFKRSDDSELELEYIVYEDEENKIEEFIENERYKVKFEVKKDKFDYKYTIISFE